MPQLVINIEQSTYIAAQEKAAKDGYLSIEDYVGDLVGNDAVAYVAMNQPLAYALNEGIADYDAGRVISSEEIKRLHEMDRARWIEANQA
jgi:predicted transcriptional regulator